LARQTVPAVKISNFLKSKMADGRHHEKSKMAIYQEWFDRSAQNLVQRCILTLNRIRKLALKIAAAVKISNFYKSKMVDGRHLKQSKMAISQKRFDRLAQNLTR